MSEFKVTSIIDEITIKTSGWKFKEREGIYVEIRGLHKYNDHTYKIVAKNRLDNLLLNNHIQLVNAEFVTPGNYDKIRCNVLLDGINVSDYFKDLIDID